MSQPTVGRPADQREPSDGARRLTVVVPAYEEGRVIATTVARLRKETEALLGSNGDADVEIVVVDDGSSDDTARRAKDAGADVVVELAVNSGKGAAIRRGVAAASGRTIVFTDADLAYSPDQVVSLALAVEDGWDVVLGSRQVAGAVAEVPATWLRRFGSQVINRCVQILVPGHPDTQCGLKAFRADVARVLFADGRVDGFGFDVEIVALAERHSLAIATVPVRVVNSRGSSVRVVRDGLGLVFDLVRIAWWLRRDAYVRPGEAGLPPVQSPAGGGPAEG
jgi:dolichyl-phosphate beta-glucosyltransferase